MRGKGALTDVVVVVDVVMFRRRRGHDGRVDLTGHHDQHVSRGREKHVAMAPPVDVASTTARRPRSELRVVVVAGCADDETHVSASAAIRKRATALWKKCPATGLTMPASHRSRFFADDAVGGGGGGDDDGRRRRSRRNRLEWQLKPTD